MTCSVVLFAHAMLYLHSSFIDGRKLTAQYVVEVAHKVLETNYALEAAGKLNRAEAQKTSLAAIRSMRYSGDEYFWINDMQPAMVMHPNRPELEGKDLSEFHDPKGKKLFVEFVAAVRSSGGGFVEYQWPKPGQTLPVSKISYVKGFAPWGWIIGSGIYLDDIEAQFRREFLQNAGLLLLIALILVAIARKITLNLTVAETLREGEAKLRGIVERLPVAALVASGQQTFLVNRRFTQLLGYDANDLVTPEDMWRLAFPDPDYRKAAFATWRRQVAQTRANDDAGNVSREYRITAKDGVEHVMEVSHCQSDEWTVTSFYDLTERKQAEAHQRLTSRVFDTTSEAILVTDTDSRIVAVNPAFCRITGYTQEDVLGKKPNILNSGRHSKSFHEAVWRSLLETGEWKGEIWNRRKNGEVFPEWQTVSSVRDEEGKVANYVAVFADLSEIRRAQETAEHLSWRDALTGLPNRSLFLKRLAQKLESAQQESKYAVVLLIDLDRFMDINEARGMALGDTLLKLVGEHFARVLDEGAVLARLSSDEFAVLLPQLVSSAQLAGRQALTAAEKLRAVLRESLWVDDEAIHLDASIGIAVFPHTPQETASDVLRQADLAMHRAKSEGGGRDVFFENAMGEMVTERYRLEGELRAAVTDGQLRLYLQPQVHAAGHQVGAEALVRWQHPERGLISPGVFIPLAEASDLVVAIDRWMLAEVCALLVRLDAAGSILRISVNISPRHFQKDDFVAEVKWQLESSGADPTRLVLEVTEGLVIGDLADVVSKMTALRTLGVHFSMDDFGTGYSSLAYLKRLPIQELKIDKSFITDATTDANDAALIETILSVAKHMKLQVVAEGVETQVQADFLNSRGDVIHQGYFYGRPMPVETWLQWAPNRVTRPASSQIVGSTPKKLAGHRD
ncbi:MAG: EAL domain-containing protein [Sulfuritalea sp.]|nr:EAL domain-containing protein [Sulfuritalea sp.]